MDTVAAALILFIIGLLFAYKWCNDMRIYHKQQHEHFKKEAIKNFDDLMSVLKKQE